jgi:hypothetical protein
MTTLSNISLANILSIRKKRLSLQREADLLEQEEKGLTGQLINEMEHLRQTVRKEGDDEVRLIMSEEPVVAVDGWPAVLDYIVANKAVDLLQKRLTPSAVKARWDEGEIIVGIEKVRKYSVKFNV